MVKCRATLELGMVAGSLSQQAARNLMALEVEQATDNARASAALHWKTKLEEHHQTIIGLPVHEMPWVDLERAGPAAPNFEDEFKALLGPWGMAARNLIALNLPDEHGGSAEMMTAKDRDRAVAHWMKELQVSYDPYTGSWSDQPGMARKKKKAKKASRRRWPQVRPLTYNHGSHELYRHMGEVVVPDPVFEKRTGTYRNFDRKRFIVDDTFRTKTQARHQAAVWRHSGFNARVVTASNGYVVYIRKRPNPNPQYAKLAARARASRIRR